MSDRGEDWSDPEIYRAGQLVPSRTFTGADPISAVLYPVWELEQYEREYAESRGRTQVESPPAGTAGPAAPPSTGTRPPQWSEPTYSGRRRHRPKRTPGAITPADPSLDAPAAPPADLDAGWDTGLDTGLDAGWDTGLDTGFDTGRAVEARPAEVETDRAVLTSSRTMAVASLASRVTGFLRSILLLAALGSTSAVSIAYNSGNTFPNMVYELLLGGVLSSVFIPLLVHAEKEDDDDGVAYAQRLMSLATVALGALTMLAVLAAPLISGVFVEAGPKRELTTVFATLLLPEIFFYGLGAMFMAVLNIRHVYAPGAWAPVLNNVIMIVTLGVFWLLPGPNVLLPTTITNAQVLVLGIGTTLGIAAQALVLLPYLRRSGFRWRWRFRARPNEVGRMREVGVLAGWVLVYVVASQIGVSVIQRVGNTNGGYTVFTNVDLLFQVPYGILVVSLLTAIMPRMSRNAVRGDNGAVKTDLRLGASMSAIGMVPITFGLIVLSVPLCVTLFAHGRTTIDGAHLLGGALAWSAFGLLPFSIVMLQLRVFYAMRDGKTAAVINIFMVGSKVVMVLISNAVYAAPAGTDVNVNPSTRAVEWLNIATSMSYVVGAIVGHIVLTRRLGNLGFGQVTQTTVRIAMASAVGAAAAWGAVRLSESQFGTAHLGELVALIAGSVLGLLVMIGVAVGMRIREVDQLVAALRRRSAS